MAGDQDPSTMVKNWLKTWASQQTVNGITLAARPAMLTKVLGPQPPIVPPVRPNAVGPAAPPAQGR